MLRLLFYAIRATYSITNSTDHLQCIAERVLSVEKFSNVPNQVHNFIADPQKLNVSAILNKDNELTTQYNPLHPAFNNPDEQCSVLIDIIKCYFNSSTSFLKYQLVRGMPGSGKNFVVTHALFLLFVTASMS